MNEVCIKEIAEDFFVEEIPTPNSNRVQNSFKYLFNKKGISTFDAIENISRFFSIPLSDISYCGFKDEEGITR